ncbi:MAG: universal stress protein, partial [Burkholderiales bacterium]|nr:universal stress protein [Burkholderiales bacterium]
PGHVLVDLAENYGCDAVVIGIGPGAPGPVVQALMAHSPVPVTLVRMPEPEPESDSESELPAA